MSCTQTSGYTSALDAAFTAIQNREFVDAFTCTYAGTLGGLLVVGTFAWFTISIMSFVRTGSFAMPVVYTLLFGGAVLAQVAAPVLGFASLLIAGGFALMALLIARRMERP